MTLAIGCCRTSLVQGEVLDNPDKYRSIADLTDLLGVRIITYFPDQVDDVAAIIEREFDMAYENCGDKRTALDADRFGYLPVHYIATLNQARAALIETEETVPREMRRRFCRLAGLLQAACTQVPGRSGTRARPTRPR